MVSRKRWWIHNSWVNIPERRGVEKEEKEVFADRVGMRGEEPPIGCAIRARMPGEVCRTVGESRRGCLVSRRWQQGSPGGRAGDIKVEVLPSE